MLRISAPFPHQYFRISHNVKQGETVSVSPCFAVLHGPDNNIIPKKRYNHFFSHGGGVVVVTVDDFVCNRFDVRNR